VVFITLNAAGAENLRKRLKLSAHSDPTYSPLGSGNKTHLPLFFCRHMVFNNKTLCT